MTHIYFSNVASAPGCFLFNNTTAPIDTADTSPTPKPIHKIRLLSDEPGRISYCGASRIYVVKIIVVLAGTNAVPFMTSSPLIGSLSPVNVKT